MLRLTMNLLIVSGRLNEYTPIGQPLSGWRRSHEHHSQLSFATAFSGLIVQIYPLFFQFLIL